jgi:hypothetical protein
MAQAASATNPRRRAVQSPPSAKRAKALDASPAPNRVAVDPVVQWEAGQKRAASLDFRGRRELDWDAIEMAIHKITAHAVTVELVGRASEDTTHGQRLEPVFSLLSEEIEDQISRLWDLLGFKEVRS